MNDGTHAIGVGVNGRGRIFFVTGFAVKKGKCVYWGFDLYGCPCRSQCLKMVSWKEAITKLKWRLSQ